MSKRIMISVLCAFSIIATGCGAKFEIQSTTPVDIKTSQAVSDYEKELNISTEPEYVASMEKPDKSLYEPVTFAATKGFPEIKLLVANDFFLYEPLEGASFSQIDAITEPTNISVRFYPYGYSEGAGKFSCFVYRVDEDYVYLGTAGHCIVEKNGRDNCEIIFYDRTKMRISLDEYRLGNKYTSVKGDYAMYRIPTDAIPREVLIKLKQVQFAPDKIDDVTYDSTIYTGNIYAQKNTRDYDKEMPVMNPSTTYAGDVINTWSWIGSDMYFVVSGALVAGQSGSAFFDSQGYLVGIASGTGHWNGNNYSINYKGLKA